MWKQFLFVHPWWCFQMRFYFKSLFKFTIFFFFFDNIKTEIEFKHKHFEHTVLLWKFMISDNLESIFHYAYLRRDGQNWFRVSVYILIKYFSRAFNFNLNLVSFILFYEKNTLIFIIKKILIQISKVKAYWNSVNMTYYY